MRGEGCFYSRVILPKGRFDTLRFAGFALGNISSCFYENPPSDYLETFVDSIGVLLPTITI